MSEEKWLPIKEHKRSDFVRFDIPVEVIGFDKNGNAWQGAAFLKVVPHKYFKWVAVKKRWFGHPLVHPTHFRPWQPPEQPSKREV